MSLPGFEPGPPAFRDSMLTSSICMYIYIMNNNNTVNFPIETILFISDNNEDCDEQVLSPPIPVVNLDNHSNNEHSCNKESAAEVLSSK